MPRISHRFDLYAAARLCMMCVVLTEQHALYRMRSSIWTPAHEQHVVFTAECIDATQSCAGKQ